MHLLHRLYFLRFINKLFHLPETTVRYVMLSANSKNSIKRASTWHSLGLISYYQMNGAAPLTAKYICCFFKFVLMVLQYFICCYFYSNACSR